MWKLRVLLVVFMVVVVTNESADEGYFEIISMDKEYHDASKKKKTSKLGAS
jgi:hypothetical protein